MSLAIWIWTRRPKCSVGMGLVSDVSRAGFRIAIDVVGDVQGANGGKTDAKSICHARRPTRQGR